jgi:hypothetical protein
MKKTDATAAAAMISLRIVLILMVKPSAFY